MSHKSGMSLLSVKNMFFTQNRFHFFPFIDLKCRALLSTCPIKNRGSPELTQNYRQRQQHTNRLNRQLEPKTFLSSGQTKEYLPKNQYVDFETKGLQIFTRLIMLPLPLQRHRILMVLLLQLGPRRLLLGLHLHKLKLLLMLMSLSFLGIRRYENVSG